MSEDFYDRCDEFGPGDEDEFLTMIQWSHEHAGFEIPVHNLPPDLELPPPFERVEVLHTGGAEEAWVSPRLDLAILGLRQRLEQRADGVTVVVPAGAGKVGQDGVRSRKHVTGVCRQLVEAGFLDLVMFTAKSSVSADLGAALRVADEFRRAAGWAASEKAGRRVTFPRWAFCTPLLAGKPQRTQRAAG
jgi:hypothetical protein